MENEKILAILSILIVFCSILLLTSSIDAGLSYPPDSPADLKVSCFDNDEDLCSDSVTCNITIIYPNGTLFANNEPMTYNLVYYNYTTSTLKTKGEYNVIVFCNSALTQGYKSFSFYVTNYPIISDNNSQGIVAIGILISSLVVSIIFMMMGFKYSGKPTALFFTLMSFVFLIIAIQQGYVYSSDILISEDASNFQMKIYIGLFYGLIGVSLITLTFLIIKTILQIRERKALVDYGEGWNIKTGQYE